jgi:glycosyltransferase involved in cell wall biosynthesis
MPPPKLSVCIDVFNYARFLPDAIESVLGQSFRDFELIIVDDCSTDDSFEIAQAYAARDSRIRAFRNTSNLGMVKNRNACLRLASGAYVKFVHADDYLAVPDALEKMAALMDHNPAASLVASSLQFVDEKRCPAGLWSCFKDERPVSGTSVILRSLRDQRNLIGGPSAVMFRRDRAGRGFDERYFHSADWEMWFYLLEQGCFAFIREPLCAYRLHGSQQTEKDRTTLTQAQDGLALLDDYLDKPYVRMGRLFKKYLRADAQRQIAWQSKKLGLSAEESWSAAAVILKHAVIRPARFFERHLKPRLQPKPHRLPGGINLAGFLAGEYGIGDSSRAYCAAIERTGLPLARVNIRSKVHSNRGAESENFSSRNPYSVNLMTFSFDYARRFYKDMGAPFFRDRTNIALWYWELEKFPARWHPAFDYYEEIWTATEFCRAAFADVSPVPVKKITYPFQVNEAPPDRARFGLAPGSFVFLFNFDYCSQVARKNPDGLIRAFRQAFDPDEDAVLVLKTINPDFDPAAAAALHAAAAGAKIVFLEDHLRAEEMASLFASADCYVSLHRSEGFGLGMARAMHAGKPVIGTGYSGNLEFMNAGNSLLVRHRLTEIERDFGPYEKGLYWADPDLEHAAELMRRVFTHRDEAAQLGRQAARDIRVNLSPEKTQGEILARLREVGA